MAHRRLEGLRARRRPVDVEDLIQRIIVASGNDACVVVAESVAHAGRFVDMMNKRARELGLRNSHFVNPTGCPTLRVS